MLLWHHLFLSEKKSRMSSSINQGRSPIPPWEGHCTKTNWKWTPPSEMAVLCRCSLLCWLVPFRWDLYDLDSHSWSNSIQNTGGGCRPTCRWICLFPRPNFSWHSCNATNQAPQLLMTISKHLPPQASGQKSFLNIFRFPLHPLEFEGWSILNDPLALEGFGIKFQKKNITNANPNLSWN